ncbi:amino acid adenylation domain-containing protein [Ktedonosporobacter rubrisoli]|uniref:Amino acid adenylation domain-containing protein n=1 Tax=Ktedonosporobacter rubrisoli TaxID=2509675 RepID=A0A4V0YYR9_KTERU|nr:amino acid adenylation domain-containing protein [Ktedonosporobacter rubrisoli]QBD77181.1 amino acid adenylation domain-containing protein [Ktedonosporobacter rubrisoli]
MSLRDIVLHAAQTWPDALAVKGPDRSLSYRELDAYASRFASCLAQLEMQAGDRVGIWLEKSALAIAAMQGILRLNGVYVPLDPLSPSTRIGTIVKDCGIQVVITTQSRAKLLRMQETCLPQITYLCLDKGEYGPCWEEFVPSSPQPIIKPPPSQDDMAYILYTSGSTGVPKGVCISQRNALAFIQWAVTALPVTSTDHFANHAPFHFDLSVFDLYVAFSVGASVYLISESMSLYPEQLVDFIRREEISIWYSVPSVLLLMMQQGDQFVEASRSLRIILYAGEVFPLKQIRRLCQILASARIFNLYGPTETNVCTFYEISDISLCTNGIPIGRACSGDTVWAQKEDGTPVQQGEEGELMVAGPSVMLGYWGKPQQGKRPYATGDKVLLQEDGNYLYRGRYDSLVKIRGNRVELGEIEAALERHPAIQEVAVLAVGTALEARLIAFVNCLHQASLSLLEIKRYCAEHLPRYMIIDNLQVLPTFPRMSNGKIDRNALLHLALKKLQEENECKEASL